MELKITWSSIPVSAPPYKNIQCESASQYLICVHPIFYVIQPTHDQDAFCAPQALSNDKIWYLFNYCSMLGWN